MWKAIKELLPNESIHYLADQANCPYGSRPQQDITALCQKHVSYLLAQQSKIIVIACNTATAASITSLRNRFHLPIVGMEPAIKPAAIQTESGHIGILATEGTLTGALYQRTSKLFASEKHIHIQIGDGLVEMVEKGEESSQACEHLLSAYLDPMLAAGIDQLVLGCTHFPFLIPTLKRIVSDRVNIIDPSAAVARQVLTLLDSHELLAPPHPHPSYHFTTTGPLIPFQQRLHTLLPSSYLPHIQTEGLA